MTKTCETCLSLARMLRRNIDQHIRDRTFALDEWIAEHTPRESEAPARPVGVGDATDA